MVTALRDGPRAPRPPAIPAQTRALSEEALSEAASNTAQVAASLPALAVNGAAFPAKSRNPQRPSVDDEPDAVALLGARLRSFVICLPSTGNDAEERRALLAERESRFSGLQAHLLDAGVAQRRLRRLQSELSSTTLAK